MATLTECVKQAGYLAAGAFLYRISFCHRITKWKDNWSAYSREEWAEAMGLTVKQYDKARVRLLERGLIETKQGMVNGIKKAYFRLAVPLGGKIQRGEIPLGGKINKKEVTSFINSKDIGACSADPEEPVKRPKQIQTRGLKAEQIATAFKNAKLSPKEPEATVTVLPGKQWRLAFHKMHPDLFLADLTLKQLGQLKMFWSKCPPGKAGKVMEWAIANWAEFCSTAQIEAGAFSMPMLPDIAFLLKFMQVAVNGMIKDESVNTAQPVQALSNNQPKWHPASKSQPIAAKATLEEVLQIVEGN